MVTTRPHSCATAHAVAKRTAPGQPELLAAIGYRFELLSRGPSPRVVDGAAIGRGVPRRPIPIGELASVLLHPSCTPHTKDVIWRHLLHLADTAAEPWVAIIVGLALPGLRHRAVLLGRLPSAEQVDIEPALVKAFLEAVRGVDASRPHVAANLVNAAFSAVRSEIRQAAPAACGEGVFSPVSALPPMPYGHPDLVLIRAVAVGVLCADEAELVGATFLEDVSVADYAERLGRSVSAVYAQRAAAVQRLVAAIRDGSLTDSYSEVVREATTMQPPRPPLGPGRPGRS